MILEIRYFLCVIKSNNKLMENMKRYLFVYDVFRQYVLIEWVWILCLKSVCYLILVKFKNVKIMIKVIYFYFGSF